MESFALTFLFLPVLNETKLYFLDERERNETTVKEEKGFLILSMSLIVVYHTTPTVLFILHCVIYCNFYGFRIFENHGSCLYLHSIRTATSRVFLR